MQLCAVDSPGDEFQGGGDCRKRDRPHAMDVPCYKWSPLNCLSLVSLHTGSDFPELSCIESPTLNCDINATG